MTVGGWTILVPELQVEPGDEVLYQIHALLDREQLNVTVEGVLHIEGESLIYIYTAACATHAHTEH